MSYSPCKATITGYLTGKQGEPKVRRKSFPATDKGEGREYCEVTVSMKVDGEKWFVSCQLPVFDYDRLLRVGERSHVTIHGDLRRKVKGDRTFYDLYYGQFLGERTADPREEGEDKPTKSKTKAKGKAAPPPPVDEDDEDTEADDDDSEF